MVPRLNSSSGRPRGCRSVPPGENVVPQGSGFRVRRRRAIAELPRDRARRARVLEGRRHLPGVDRPARGRRRVGLLRRPAVRQRPAALRPPAHRLRQGPLPALPDHARQAGAPPLRLGHPRTARRARGRAPARHHRQERDRGDGHRGLQRGRPRVGAALHEGVAGVRHPPGALGRLRERLQDPRHHLHGVGDLGVQDACTTRGSPTRATGCCRTAGATRRRCRTTSCAWTTTSTRCVRTRRSRSPSRSSGPKAEALGLTAVRALAWTTTPWTLPTNLALAVGPDIEYAVVPAGPNGTPDATVLREQAGAGASDTEVLGGEYLLATDLVGSYAKDLGYDSADDARAAVSRTVLGSRARGRHLRPALRLLRRRRGVRAAERLAHPRRRLRHHRRRHRHRAPGARLRRGGPEDLRGRRHPGHHLARRGRQVPARRDRCRRACSGATPTSRSPSC